MAEVDIRSIDKETVATFDEAAAYTGKTPEQILKKLISKGYNPYFRRNGDCIVKISFANNGTRLSDIVASMLSECG